MRKGVEPSWSITMYQINPKLFETKVYLILCGIGAISAYFPISSQLATLRLSSYFGFLEVIWPIGLTIGMILYTRTVLSTNQSRPEHSHLVSNWALVGWAVTGTIAILLVLHQQSMGGTIHYPGVVIADVAMGGAAFGTAIGGLQVTNRDRQSRLQTFQQAVEHAGHCIYFTDTDGTIEYVNPTFEEQTGYSAEEAIGRDASILNSGRHDDDFFAEMWETITSGEVWESEVINQTKFGELVHADQTIAPVFAGQDGKIDQFVAINSDITDLKEYESRLETRTEQLETLNRVLRHDIRNDMMVIDGWLDLLAEQIDDDRHDETMEKINRSVVDVIELTKIAQEYVDSLSENEKSLEEVSLESILFPVVKSLRESYPNSSINFDGQIPSVSVRANKMLLSVFRNLINNAIQHNDKSDPMVNIFVTEREETVQVTIADNGPGISKQLREDMFSKGEKGVESSGTGIGLYLVNQWVTDFGGDIEYSENDPGGSIFKIELQKPV